MFNIEGGPRATAVSYTHLDVYKRQKELELLEEAEPAESEGPAGAVEDVYKRQFLQTMLANGRQLATDMEEARQAHDISEATLRRARKDLAIQVYRDGNAWYWELPTPIKR